MLEPGRFRFPRSEDERALQTPAAIRERLFPPDVPARLFLTHTRPEVMLGVLGPLDTGVRTRGLGFINQGGTLDTTALLFLNRCSWAHCLAESARILDLRREQLLDAAEIQALEGARSPHGVLIPQPPV